MGGFGARRTKGTRETLRTRCGRCTLGVRRAKGGRGGRLTVGALETDEANRTRFADGALEDRGTDLTFGTERTLGTLGTERYREVKAPKRPSLARKESPAKKMKKGEGRPFITQAFPLTLRVRLEADAFALPCDDS
jgi:hypothetical protein